MSPIIFCPQCDKFIGEKPCCPQCGWEREAEEAAPAGQEVWRFAARDKLYAAPTIHQGTLYLGTEDGVLHAVDARQGNQIWRFPLPEHWLPTEAACSRGAGLPVGRRWRETAFRVVPSAAEDEELQTAPRLSIHGDQPGRL